jgi:hypothetical protein
MDEFEQVKAFRADLPVPDQATVERSRASLDRAISGEQHSRRRLSTPRRGLVLAGAATGALVAAVVLAVVVPSLRDTSSSSARPSVIYGDGLLAFALDTPSDVVSHADQVSLVTAVSSIDLNNPTPEEAAAGEWLIMRKVTFRIDRTLWRRTGSPQLTGTTQAVEDGWAYKDSERTKFIMRGTPWIEVGSQYVMPFSLANGEWAPLGPAGFPYVNGRSVPAVTQETPLARLVSGRSLDEVATIYAAASRKSARSSTASRAGD